MKTKLLLCILVCISFIACNKSNNPDIPQPTTLKSIVIEHPGNADSVKYDFTYNASSKLVQEKYTILYPPGIVFTTTYNRNSSGYITDYLKTGDFIFTDTLNVDEFGKYGYDIFTTHSSFSSGQDSIVFTYTGNNITQAFGYVLGLNMLAQKVFYTYDSNGNITKIETYWFNGATWLFKFRTTFTYDNYINPLQLGNETLINAKHGDPYENMVFTGPNNVLTIAYEDMYNPVNNYSSSYVYTYGGNNYPLSATGTTIPSGKTSLVSYQY